MSLRRIASALLLGLLTIGAGPPPVGTDASIGAGVGRYTFGDCGGWSYRVPDVPAHARVSHSFGGPAITAEGTFSAGEIDARTLHTSANPPASPTQAVGQTATFATGTLRVGYHWPLGGFEVGPHISKRSGTVCERNPRDCSMSYLASGELWLGEPSIAFVWGRFLAGPPVNALGTFRGGTVEVGAGHVAEQFRVAAGFGLAGVMAEGDVGLGAGRSLRVGSSLHYLDAGNWAALATVGVRIPDGF